MKKLWCIYASHYTDSVGRDMAVGDGITASSRRIYALCTSLEMAERMLANFGQSRFLTKARIPGDGCLYPCLEIDDFDPLDFIGRQNRDEYSGKRLAALYERLIVQASENGAELARKA